MYIIAIGMPQYKQWLFFMVVYFILLSIVIYYIQQHALFIVYYVTTWLAMLYCIMESYVTTCCKDVTTIMASLPCSYA